MSPVLHTLTVTLAGTGTGTVASGPAGIDCGADCTEAYLQGTRVTLTPVAGANSTFVGWTGRVAPTFETLDNRRKSTKSLYK